MFARCGHDLAVIVLMVLITVTDLVLTLVLTLLVWRYGMEPQDAPE